MAILLGITYGASRRREASKLSSASKQLNAIKMVQMNKFDLSLNYVN